MNILVVCPYGLYSDLSYSFVHNQIREYVKLGHRVRALILNGLGKTGENGARVFPLVGEKTADGVEVRYVRYLTASQYGEKRFNTQMAVAAIAAQEKRLLADFCPDVIHAQTLMFASDIGAWLKKKYGCPLVVTTHGTDTELPMARGDAAYLRAAADRADTVVAVSGKLQRRLAQCGTGAKLMTIYNGFQPHPEFSGVQKQPRRLIQVGNLIASKRVDVTLRALALLREMYPDMTLTVVGSGPERAALDALCRELGLDSAVRFTGRLPNPEVARELAEAACFVMASKPEGFGIVYLEAMAAGCAAVGTAGEGIAELIENGSNGFLVMPDDPQAIAHVIAACMEDPVMLRTVAQRGQRDVQGLTWASNAKKYTALFEELVKG